MMQVAVLKETAAREHRVALTPESAGRLVKSKVDVIVENGAGAGAGAGVGCWGAGCCGAGCCVCAPARAKGVAISRSMRPPTRAATTQSHGARIRINLVFCLKDDFLNEFGRLFLEPL